jgi:hypothetical protein
MAEKKKLDLRRKPTQVSPPPVAPTDQKAIPNLVPSATGPSFFQPGQVIDPRFMTAFEKKQLESIGWEKGTPVPGNAAELIAAIQQEASVEGLLPVPADTPPLVVPPPIDISRLPQAKQQELREALEQAGRYHDEFREQEAAAAGLAPGVAEAMRVANTVARNSP